MEWVLGVVIVVFVALAIVVGRRQRGSYGPGTANDRLGVKDPRETPWGPPSSF